MNNFIGEYFLSHKIADDLLDFYNLNTKTQGVIYCDTNGASVNKDIKNVLEVEIDKDDMTPAIFNFRKEQQICLENYMNKFEALKEISPFNINENLLLSKSEPNEGYKVYHNERGALCVSKRVLFFIMYLNDVPDGGLNFLYFDKKIEAKKGKLIFMPTEWTHQHIGESKNTISKYYITGWYSFNE